MLRCPFSTSLPAQPMTQRLVLFCFLALSVRVNAQQSAGEYLATDELKMTFPAIYFKHNSTNYAAMPYTADSCLKYIATGIKDVNDLVIWRDTTENELLSIKRAKKIKAGLSKYTRVGGIEIQSMKDRQKVSRYVINQTNDSLQRNYLITLNSVFEIAKMRSPPVKKKWWQARTHTEGRLFCFRCWKYGRTPNRLFKRKG